MFPSIIKVYILHLHTPLRDLHAWSRSVAKGRMSRENMEKPVYHLPSLASFFPFALFGTASLEGIMAWGIVVLGPFLLDASGKCISLAIVVKPCSSTTIINHRRFLWLIAFKTSLVLDNGFFLILTVQSVLVGGTLKDEVARFQDGLILMRSMWPFCLLRRYICYFNWYGQAFSQRYEIYIFEIESR